MKRAVTIFAVLALAGCGKTPSFNEPKPVAAPAVDVTAAQDLVRGLYAKETVDDQEPAKHDALFAPDLSASLKKDSSDPGEVGAVDFDWRYGAQDWRIAHLAFNSHALPGGGARVQARFENFGKPYEVDYDLVRPPAGWRIADVSAPAQNGDQAWSLRAMLKLTPLR